MVNLLACSAFHTSCPSAFSQAVASLRPLSYSAATSSSSSTNPTAAPNHAAAPYHAAASNPAASSPTTAPVSVPVNPSVPAAGRTNRSQCFTEIDRKYRQVVAFTNSGLTVGDALEAVNLKKRTFRRWRIVAEARLIDERRAGIQHHAGPPSESNPGGLLLAGEDNLGKVLISTEAGIFFP